MIRRLLDGLYLFAGWLAGVFLIAVFLLMMALSVGRQFGINVKSGDDITSWCMAAMAFLALAHTFRSGEIIRMGLVIEKLSGRPRQVAELLALAAGSMLVGYLAWHACKMTYESWLLNDISGGVLAIPLWIPQLGFAVGTAVLLVAFFDELVHVARGNHPHYAKAPPRTREEVMDRAASGNL
jgi:TRAP-type C4-dicarboxylate transport system permease small subunit